MRYETPYTCDEVCYDGSRFDVLDQHFEKMMKKNQLQGASYCMSRDGKKFVENSVGNLSFDDATSQLLPDSIFQIASITKLFTATAIFRLVEEGIFRLNQPVKDILEEFQQGPFQEIQIAHLLSHTSGLQPDPGCFANPYYLSAWDFIEKGFEKQDEQWLKNALHVGLRSKPGTEWAYCSIGFVILGEIITRTTGIRYDEFIKKEIITKCEMKDTFFKHDFSHNKLDRLAIVSKKQKEYIEQIKQGKDPELNKTEILWNLVPQTGNGILSTTSDLVKFGTMLEQGGYYGNTRVIGRKTIEKMTSRYTGSEIKDYCWGAGGVEREYGSGPDLRNNIGTIYSKGTYFHEGAGSSCLMIDPVEHLVAAWYVPYRDGAWYAEGLYNAANIMWSGLR